MFSSPAGFFSPWATLRYQSDIAVLAMSQDIDTRAVSVRDIAVSPCYNSVDSEFFFFKIGKHLLTISQKRAGHALFSSYFVTLQHCYS